MDVVSCLSSFCLMRGFMCHSLVRWLIRGSRHVLGTWICNLRCTCSSCCILLCRLSGRDLQASQVARSVATLQLATRLEMSLFRGALSVKPMCLRQLSLALELRTCLTCSSCRVAIDYFCERLIPACTSWTPKCFKLVVLAVAR